MNREQAIISGIIATTALAVAGVVSVYVRGGNDSSQIAFAILGLASPTIASLFAALTGTQAKDVATDVQQTVEHHSQDVSEKLAAVTAATTPAKVGEVVSQVLADNSVIATNDITDTPGSGASE